MSQVQRKFIANDAINGSKIRLDNNEVLRARNAANTADVSILKVDATDALELQLLPVAAGALPIPTSDKQFATVEYIKNYVLGKVDAKDAVNLMAESKTRSNWYYAPLDAIRKKALLTKVLATTTSATHAGFFPKDLSNQPVDISNR